MSSQPARTPIDLAPAETARPGLAVALAAVSVPGVTIAWDLSPVAGLAGVAVAVAAIVVGLQARARLPGDAGKGMATAAVAIASLAVLSVGFFLAVGTPD